ncbi:MAG: DUF4282 domain-containing protein, partial [bacterium]|nr:DUF4282 domain-containing protein [bacterium]
GIAAIAFIIGGFGRSTFIGIIFLIISPIIFIIYTILVRVWLELVIVMFRISEDVRTLVKSKSI